MVKMAGAFRTMLLSRMSTSEAGLHDPHFALRKCLGFIASLIRPKRDDIDKKVRTQAKGKVDVLYY